VKSRKIVWGIAGLVATGVATLALAMGSSTAAIGASTAPVALPVTAQASAEDIAKFNLATDRVFGTPAQRRLAEEYVNREIGAAVGSCMAKVGYGYNNSQFKGIEVSAAFTGYDIAAPLGEFNQAKMVEGKGRTLDSSTDTNLAKAADKAAYQQTANACGKANRPEIKAAIANARPTDRLAFGGNQAKADELSTASIDFQRAVGLLQRSDTGKTLSVGYQSCLAQHGFAATSWRDLYEQVSAKYKGLLGKPWKEIGLTQQWKDAGAYETAASVADKTCRSGIRLWMIASMRKTVDRILIDLRTAELGQGWKAIENKARLAGLS
jgi:hypothetical protein